MIPQTFLVVPLPLVVEIDHDEKQIPDEKPVLLRKNEVKNTDNILQMSELPNPIPVIAHRYSSEH